MVVLFFFIYGVCSSCHSKARTHWRLICDAQRDASYSVVVYFFCVCMRESRLYYIRYVCNTMLFRYRYRRKVHHSARTPINTIEREVEMMIKLVLGNWRERTQTLVCAWLCGDNRFPEERAIFYHFERYCVHMWRRKAQENCNILRKM